MSVAATGAALTLVLPGFVPDARLSLNGRRRSHWTAVSRDQEAAQWHLTAALQDIQTPPRFERASVTFEFVFPTHRRRDPDGLAGRVKPLLDGLVRWGILPDDDCEHVELRVRAVVDPRTTETRISIEPIQ